VGAGVSTLGSAPASMRASTATSSPLRQASMRAVKPWSLRLLTLAAGSRPRAWDISSGRPLVSSLKAISRLKRRTYSVSSILLELMVTSSELKRGHAHCLSAVMKTSGISRSPGRPGSLLPWRWAILRGRRVPV
jgi:hypothetical protein